MRFSRRWTGIVSSKKSYGRAKATNRHDARFTHNGRAKTRLRKAYVAANSMALHKYTARARQSEATAASARRKGRDLFGGSRRV
jgi:hypothetical protein